MTLPRGGRKLPPRDDVNAKDNDFLTPLHCAVLSGHTSVVAKLLQWGADPSAVSKLSDSPLCLAAALGHGEIVDLLGGDHPRDAVSTPLHQAARYGRVEMIGKPQVRRFLDTIDGCGETALHVAVRGADPRMVFALIDHGADVGPLNEDGHTPLRVAMNRLDHRKSEARATPTGRLRRASGYRPDVALQLVAAGHVVRRQRGDAERAALPERLVAQMDKWRAVVLTLISHGAQVVGLGRSHLRLCVRLVASAHGYGPRQAARLRLTGRVRPPAREVENGTSQ